MPSSDVGTTRIVQAGSITLDSPHPACATFRLQFRLALAVSAVRVTSHWSLGCTTGFPLLQ